MRARLLFSAVLLLAAVPACGSAPATTDDASAVDAGPTDAARYDAAARACFVDDDCNDGFYCNGTEACVNGFCARTPLSCDDGVACTSDLCNENTHACVSHAPDADGDGFGDARCTDRTGVPLGTDCDDADPTIYPGNPEICDAIDQDCDPTTLGGGDTDHDGAVPIECCNPTPTGMSCGRDCDDGNPSISQLATEICDHVDNDCDTHVDEHVELMSWPDVDLDGFGDASVMPEITCSVPSFRANVGGDCDDAQLAIHPMAPERCNGLDDDCDGTVDEGADAACAVPGATMECISGACTVIGCDANRFDCNGSASDGCETALCGPGGSSCGVCGRTCGLGACNSGYCPLYAELNTTVSGYVFDAETRGPAAGLTVTSIGICPEVSTTTGADGHYAFDTGELHVPLWVRITGPGYPPHVQPVGGGSYVFPSSTVDAWRADPDANTTPGPNRAILVIEGGEVPQAIHDGHVGPSNGATGSDLSPFTAFGDRVVYLGAVPGEMHLGGTVPHPSGCSDVCTPAIHVLLEAGAVTHVDGFSCIGVC